MTYFAFSPSDTIDNEMRRITAINQATPDIGRKMFQTGEMFVSLAANGSLHKVRKFLEDTPAESLLIYFVYKALKVSLVNGHLMVSSYIIDCGYPLNHDGLPNIVKECLAELDDYLCVAIIRMLASKGLDVCKQAPVNWWTALHHAVQCKRVETVSLLIQLGADVNAVAEHDAMPLNLAQSLPESGEKDDIVNKLLASGAKVTWRKSAASITAYTSPQESTMMSVSNTRVTSSSVPVAGGGAAAAATGAAVETKKFVKFTGGSDVSNVFTIPMKIPAEVAVAVTLRSSGGGSKVEDGVDTSSGGLQPPLLNDGISDGTAVVHFNSDDYHSNASFVVASDGGMMFSTGN